MISFIHKAYTIVILQIKAKHNNIAQLVEGEIWGKKNEKLGVEIRREKFDREKKSLNEGKEWSRVYLFVN